MFKPMTPKQKSFIFDLVARVHETTTEPRAYEAAESIMKTLRIGECPEERQVSQAEASTMIDLLLSFNPPRRSFAKTTAPAQGYPEVPKGRYGIIVDGHLRFFRVTRTRPDHRGISWTRLAEVKDVTGSGRPRHIPIKDATRKLAILTAILAGGLNEGMALYGQHLGMCGRCNHTLTDDYSRLAGIGPHCRHLLGIPVDPALQRQAKAEEIAKAHPASLVHVG